MLKEFIGFLKAYGVIGLAIAVIIGGKLNDFVSSLVKDLLMPLIFQPLLKSFAVDDIAKLQMNGIYFGKVIGAGIDFLIVAFVVFIFAKYVLKEKEVSKK